MTSTAWLLLSWILVGAAFLFVHLVAVFQALRARGLRLWVRLLAFVPPAAPVLAWVAGARVVPVLWCAILVTYVVLRLQA